MNQNEWEKNNYRIFSKNLEFAQLELESNMIVFFMIHFHWHTSNSVQSNLYENSRFHLLILLWKWILKAKHESMTSKKKK